ncbi:ATP-binding protein [Marinoscillum luteum]|uniref:ATP-binding protein n=1 Tax=Marinoscillum luteum TaxID=861051 RepID=A0ABW7N2Z7_9BACT
MTKEEKLIKLRSVFSPMSPIKNQDLFFGRIHQLDNVCDAINEQGQHAILYGERGVGKTSLGNIMATQLTNVFPVKVTCSRDDDFKSLWHRAFQKIPLATTTTGIGFTSEEQTSYTSLASRILDIEDVLPANIESMLMPVLNNRILFVFDEFDNINKNRVREQFADLIKSLSDNCDNITIIIIGISDNVVNLLGNHQSLERCLKQIRMPRMTPDELGGIIDNGINVLELEIVKDVRKKILEFSSGFPHYTHLLCKYGCKAVIEDDKLSFNRSYLKKAIALAIENVQEQIKDAFRKATFSSSAESQWEQVLFACATSKTDEYNCFTIKEITNRFADISGKDKSKVNISYNLGKLCQTERGAILEKISIDGGVKFRFSNPLSKAFVILKMNHG